MKRFTAILAIHTTTPLNLPPLGTPTPSIQPQPRATTTTTDMRRVYKCRGRMRHVDDRCGYLADPRAIKAALKKLRGAVLMQPQSNVLIIYLSEPPTKSPAFFPHESEQDG